MSSPVRAGLVGYGLAGRAIHAPAIAGAPGIELSAIATRQREAIEGDWPGVVANMFDRFGLAAPDEAKAISSYLAANYGSD